MVSLNIKINDDEYNVLEKIAEQSGITTVEQLISKWIHEHSKYKDIHKDICKNIEISPIVKDLTGILSQDIDIEKEKKAYKKYLQGKHE